jgi:hypothetical protein
MRCSLRSNTARKLVGEVMKSFFGFVLLSCLLFQTASGAGDDFKASQSRIADAIEKMGQTQDKIFLYSLNPKQLRISEGKPPENSDEVFHGYPILGRVEITSPEEKIRLLSAFVKGVRENSGFVLYCFDPRHGIRMVSETTTNDFAICFECLQVQAYGFNGGGNFLTSNSPRTVFNDVLKKYHIKGAQ